LTDGFHRDAHGGGYWAARPAGDARPGRVVVDVGSVPAFALETAGHTFSPGRLDPGTALLLRALDRYLAGAGALPARLADLGAGYGPLGLWLARRLPDAHVTLVERNARAAGLAHGNAHALGLGNVTVHEGDATELLDHAPPFDLIATNPPIRAGRRAYGPWLDGAARYLTPQGTFWFVARTAQGADTLADMLARSLVDVAVAERGSGYKVVCGRGPGPAGDDGDARDGPPAP